MVPLLFAGVIAWLYGQTLISMVREWAGSADASYGAILAIVALIIAWRRRAFLVFAGDDDRRLGGVLLALGIGLYTAGALGADVFLTRVSLPLVLAGAVGVIVGRRALRGMLAPLTFLILAIPLPALVVNTITLPMQLVASRLAESFLAMGDVPVLREGNLLQLPGGTLEVAAACSGLRSLVSLGALSVLLAWTMRARPWRRAVVVAAAVPIALVANAVRIAATGFISETWTRSILAGRWHEFTGWLTFLGALGLLAVCARQTPAGAGRLATILAARPTVGGVAR